MRLCLENDDRNLFPMNSLNLRRKKKIVYLFYRRNVRTKIQNSNVNIQLILANDVILCILYRKKKL